MSKNIFKYCKECDKKTEHLKEHSEPIGMRIFIGILSLGASETAVQHWYECTECGKKS